MGKKINFQVCDDICMFQVFKEYVRVNEDNEFFVDGNFVTGIEERGVIVDFQNFNHTYEIFNLLGPHWGGWEQTPTAQSMYCIAKKWEEAYKAEKEAECTCKERGRAVSYAPRKGKRAVRKLCECLQ